MFPELFICPDASLELSSHLAVGVDPFRVFGVTLQDELASSQVATEVVDNASEIGDPDCTPLNFGLDGAELRSDV